MRKSVLAFVLAVNAVALTSGLVAVLGMLGLRDQEIVRQEEEIESLRETMINARGEMARLNARISEMYIESTYGNYLSRADCITFVDTPAGKEYVVGEVGSFSGTNVEFKGFVWRYGQAYEPVYEEGVAIVDRVGRWGDIGGSDHDIMTDNINMSLGFPIGTRHVTVRYGDWGGNINLSINADFRSYSTFADIRDHPFPGVDMVIREADFTNHRIGMLEFRATSAESIESMMIGGQELIIDDICWEQEQSDRVFDVGEGWVEVFDVGSEVVFEDAIGETHEVIVTGYYLLMIGGNLHLTYAYENDGIEILILAEQVSSFGGDTKIAYWNPRTGERQEGLTGASD